MAQQSKNCKSGRKSQGKNSPKRWSNQRDWKGNKKDKDVEQQEKTNNPAWYMTNPALTNGVASIPFNVPLGDTINMANESGLAFTQAFSNTFRDPNLAQPGICVVDLVPSFGQQIDPSSSLNTAAQALFTLTRYQISGSRKYTPSDLMIYLIGNGQIYSALNWAMRIYGTIKQYDFRNKYMSKRLLQSMRVNYDDFVGRLAEYRGRLNLIIEKASSLVVPTTLSYFERIASVYTDIYTDGNSVKDQMYMYNPDGFYWFTFDTSETPAHPGAYLAYHQLYSDTTLLGVDGVLNYLSDMVDAMFFANDQGTISGDLFKAFQGNIIKLAPMSEDYTTNIVNDPWVLNQMKNGTPVDMREFTAPDVYQSTHDYSGNLIYDPTFTIHYEDWDEEAVFTVAINRGNRILTVKDTDPKVDHVMEFSRLMTAFKDVTIMSGAHSWKYTIVCGDNVIARVRFGGMKYYNDGTLHFVEIANTMGYAQAFPPRTLAGQDWVSYMTQHLVWRRAFPYAPQIFLFHAKKESTSQQLNGYLGLSTDVDNYAVLDSDTLFHIHEVALMNLFGSDAIARLK